MKIQKETKRKKYKVNKKTKWKNLSYLNIKKAKVTMLEELKKQY